MSMGTIIKLEQAAIRQQKNTVLKNVNLEIAEGEFVYIIGRVGSGKTSLLKTLYAEIPLEYGKAEVAGFKLGKIKKSHIALLRRKCGIVFQDFKLLTDRNVYANLEFVLRATGWRDKKAIRERIDEVLEKVEMPDKKDKFPHQLSGGEQQRIVLARALLNAPPLILADEPTGNIDPETSYHLIELLKDICDSGKTVIIATHQYDLITKFPGRVFRCENGTILEDHSFSEIVAENPPLSEEEIENIVESNPEILTRNPENETSTVEECVINTTGNNMPVEESVMESLESEQMPTEAESMEEEKTEVSFLTEEKQTDKKENTPNDTIGIELI